MAVSWNVTAVLLAVLLSGARPAVANDAAQDAAPAAAQAVALPAQTPPSDPRRETVAAILRTERQDASTTLADQHARALRALDFDALPVAEQLLADSRLSTEAARAMLAIDERRAMSMIFAAIPRTSLSTQLVGFVWFLEHEGSLAGPLGPDAHAAASRVLVRIESTSMAELAVYTIGMVGSASDFPLLEEFANSQAFGAQGLRTASQAALGRLGSRRHIDGIRAQLAEPLPPRPGYQQGLRVAQVLRQAGFAANATLVPAVCAHMADPAIGDFDIRIEPARIAANSLSLILEPVTADRPRGAPRRSLDDWKAYCAQLPAAAPPAA